MINPLLSLIGALSVEPVKTVCFYVLENIID